MFNRVTIDLLFNLLLIFVCLFFISFLQIREKKKNENLKYKSNIVITMSWKTNNDMDLWLLLPDGRKVGYPSREQPPAHLDVDIVRWKKFEYNGQKFSTKNNEEVISIRDILPGEYTINVHYYNNNNYGSDPIKVQILVQDIQNSKIIYAGSKIISQPRSETHFVKFTVLKEKGGYSISNIYTDRPTYFIGD